MVWTRILGRHNVRNHGTIIQIQNIVTDMVGKR